jgi:hypothetical protein
MTRDVGSLLIVSALVGAGAAFFLYAAVPYIAALFLIIE